MVSSYDSFCVPAKAPPLLFMVINLTALPFLGEFSSEISRIGIGVVCLFEISKEQLSLVSDPKPLVGFLMKIYLLFLGIYS